LWDLGGVQVCCSGWEDALKLERCDGDLNRKLELDAEAGDEMMGMRWIASRAVEPV
jgi:hypothetical protein